MLSTTKLTAKEIAGLTNVSDEFKTIDLLYQGRF